MLAVALSLALCGCASISQKFADTASQAPQIGLPANAPSRPADQIVYPAVHDVPPPRTATVLTDVEQQKLETDLLAARSQQQTAAGVPLYKPPQDKKTAAKNKGDNKGDKNQGNQDQASTPAPISTASSRTIY